MNTIKRIQNDLEEHWNQLRSKDWQCAAQKCFDAAYCTPMLEQINILDSASEELEELCRESMAAAKSVREPDENQDWRNETWQND